MQMVAEVGDSANLVEDYQEALASHTEALYEELSVRAGEEMQS
jgi:hypothetical protein